MAAVGADDPIPWETLYGGGPVEALPWYLERLDPDVETALRDLDIHIPAVLDLGTGPGTQAIELARRGFDATGTDVSPSAVRKAAERAARTKVPCLFVEDDVLNTRINRRFDVVIDRGLLHNIPPAQRATYVQNVWRLLRPQGHLMIKSFRRETESPTGRVPYSFTAQELASLFGGWFDVLGIRPTIYHGRMVPPPASWFAILRRR